ATMHDPDSPLALDVMAQLRRKYESRLAETTIRLDPRLREAASLGIPVHELDPACDGATDYDLLASELDAANPAPARCADEDDTNELVTTSTAAREEFLSARAAPAPEPVGAPASAPPSTPPS
ncbi:MAG TPA: hypothetical protein DEB06_07260, partial [Phycisphaerales bacterium]|nr:hypothetical protein [Phycisphaerales bacterium]